MTPILKYAHPALAYCQLRQAIGYYNTIWAQEHCVEYGMAARGPCKFSRPIMPHFKCRIPLRVRVLMAMPHIAQQDISGMPS